MTVKLSIKLTPNSKKNAVLGCIDNVWNIKIAAQPIEGKANEALIKYLSDILNTAKSHIQIDKGQTSRIKIILIDGLEEDYIIQKLNDFIN